jgi:putative ABC transport system permease protein
MWLDDLVRDVGYALRTLIKNPGFATVAVLTLALGIGANTAMFSVVHAVLLKPLAYKDANRLVRLVVKVPAAQSPTGRPIRATGSMGIAERFALQPRTKTLSHVALYAPTFMTLSGPNGATRVEGTAVEPAILDMLGAPPLLGRIFGVGEDASGTDAVIILSHTMWQSDFGGDPKILGRRLTLADAQRRGNPKVYAVVGVMPQGFAFPDPRTQFWVPMVLTPVTGPMARARAPMMARLVEGVSLQAATAEVDAILHEVDGWTYELVRAQDDVVAPVKPALVMLMTAVAFVLLIACANVVNLLLARTAARQREFAIRAALGEGRGRFTRYLLTESVMLALFGGACGVVLAFGGIRLLSLLATTLSRMDVGEFVPFPRLSEIGVDVTVLTFTIVASVVTGLLCGLVPAIRQFRSRQMDALRAGASSIATGLEGFPRHVTRGGLVVAEMSLATMLFIGGGLLMHSFLKLASIEPGYNPKNVLTFQVALHEERYPPTELRTLAEDLVARVGSLPGVQAAAYAQQLPTVALRQNARFRRTPDLPPPSTPLEGVGEDLRLVSRNYFAVMGVRVIAGRGFGENDGSGRPRVLLINQALARRDFLGESPVGQTAYVGSDRNPWQIVGIVDDVRQFGLDQVPGPQVFVDFRQWAGTNPLFDVPQYFAIRTARTPTSIVSDLRGKVRQIDTDASLFNVATMEQLLANSMARPRMYAVLLGLFAGVAVIMAAVGIYGVMAYTVTQRTREIGIRMALGARRAEVMGLVLRQSVVLTAIGILLGLAGAAAVTRYLKGMLFGVTPLDPTTFVAVSLMFGLVATLASYVPARRATKVDPLVALRYE